MPKKISEINNYIEIKGARVNNLKNVNINIPRDKLIVITGLSGSGKSSLAFDTIYAEGQRRYVESLSAYARQFLGRIKKPEVDYIRGIPPAIAIEQRVSTRNPRSTVGTSTEIYDYLKLLYARIGKTISPVSGNEVKKHQVQDVVDFIQKQKPGTLTLIMAPLETAPVSIMERRLQQFQREGFSRVEIFGKIQRIGDVDLSEATEDEISAKLALDRIQVPDKWEEDTLSRIADSVQSAFSESNGRCLIRSHINEKIISREFSNRFELDGMLFEEPNEHLFSFNNPVGACPTCEGFGKVIGIDEELVIPDKTLSIYEEAIACWKGEKMSEWKNRLIRNADKFDFPVHKPYFELTEDQKEVLWKGNRHFYGLNRFFKHLEDKKYKIQYRVMLSRYRGKTNCPECKGTRLNKEAGYVRVCNTMIQELVMMPIDELAAFLKNCEFSEREKKVAGRIIKEINSRVDFLLNVGLSYLTLNRLSSSLSGGESQRINLATSLGSSLVGSLYILDEPSIGLHSRDTQRLIHVLTKLKELGNSVVVVEHDEEIIRASDEFIDIGPDAGSNGGQVIFQGNPAKMNGDAGKSYTARYLNGDLSLQVPPKRRKWNHYIEIMGAVENNLKGINVKFPLNVLTVVTGVSGSGKSSLVKNILFPALLRKLSGAGERAGSFSVLQGDIKRLQNVEFVDQNPIGRSSRSNPVTYIKAYDEIRKLFASQKSAYYNNLKPSHFSFNVDGGRCEECLGEGVIHVEMQFMADVTLVCESCGGKRFKDEVLEVKFHKKSIFEVLEMTVDDAIEFFGSAKDKTAQKVTERLQPLANVGLGYITLGQSSSTLSGGESQRVKLATFLGRESPSEHRLFIFDEPTTGLHFHDIGKLLTAFHDLIERGHSVLVIEHNMEVIKSADWIIDLGPDGGKTGGNIVCEGTPEEVAAVKKSYTGQFLKAKL